MTSRSIFSHQMRAGLFVLTGTVLLIFSLFLVGGDRFFANYVSLHARFETVQGLSAGSVVSLAGIPVGNVRKFEFIPEENKLDVELRIDANYLHRITEGSFVDIRTQGALGDKYIYIQPGPPGGNTLKDGDQIPITTSPDLLTLFSEKSKDISKVFEIMDEIHRFTKALNTDNRTDRMMKNFAESSEDMKATFKDAREMMNALKSEDSKKLSSAVEKLDQILTKIDRGEGTLGGLINDPALHESLKSLVGAPDKKKSIKSLIRSSIEKSGDQ
jgi:phospholipid/cholesterol/gamma-HCH transport system substrate-binding protein